MISANRENSAPRERAKIKIYSTGFVFEKRKMPREELHQVLAGRGGKVLGRFGQEIMPTSLDAQLPARPG